MSVELLYGWMMVFMRSLGMIMLFPSLAGRPLPVTLRAALATCLATLLYTLVPIAEVPTSYWLILGASAREVILGLLLGWTGRIVFGAVEMAGRIIANELGLTGIPGVESPQPSQEPIAALLTTFAGVLFFLSGAHLAAIAAFARSFDFAPAGHAGFSLAAADHLVAATGLVFTLGLRIAAPFIALNFLINLAFAVLGRAVPRMNVFVVSISLRAILGLFLLAGAGALFARYLWPAFEDIPLRMLELLPPLVT